MTDAVISIVVPHFNRVDLVLETIESIEKQDFLNWEVIIVDDGSSDAQWTDLQKLATDKIHVHQRTDGEKGPSRCRNIGASKAKGKYILFVDSDDLLAHWCLSLRLGFANQHPDNDFWVFRVMLFNQSPGDTRKCWNQLERDNELQQFLSAGSPWHTSSPLWKREALLNIGGFNESVFYGDDSELHIKALLHKLNFKKCLSCLPDSFVRRSAVKRITNERSTALLTSRKVRLYEGTKLLDKMDATESDRHLWEGQYIVEAEEMLFNINNPRNDIHTILLSWNSLYHPNRMRRWVVGTYFRIGIACRKHAYLILRIARRVAMVMLPNSYFPSGRNFRSARVRLDDEIFSQLTKRLAQQ